MALQFSIAYRNAMLDLLETTLGAAPKLQIRSGAPPANCAAADTGTLLAEYTLASDWAPGASAGSKGLNGLPLTVNAVGAGTAGHYRFKDSAGTTCHEQGTVGTSGADITIDNTNIAVGQKVDVTAFSKTAPGA